MPGTQLWVIYALAFGAVLLGVQGFYWFYSYTRVEQKAINRRLALGQQLQSPAQVLDVLRRERGLGVGGALSGFVSLQQLVVQSGLRFQPQKTLAISIAVAAALFLIFLRALGNELIAAILAIVLTGFGAYLFLYFLRGKRVTRFGEQFPDAIDIIVRGLRAGHPFRVAIGLVAREMPDPIGSEFGIFADEITFGLSLPAAASNLVERVGHEDLAFFVVAINIQTQTGGNLAEILSRLSRLIRSRTKLRLKIRALTSEGRLSAIFLSVAPFVLIGIISLISPAYYGAVLGHPIILPAAIFGLVLVGIGQIMMYKLAHFKV